MRRAVYFGAISLVAMQGLAAETVSSRPPVRVVRDAGSTPPPGDQVLYREGNVELLRAPTAAEADFESLYVVDLSGRFDLPATHNVSKAELRSRISAVSIE